MSYVDFRLAYLELTLTFCKGQLGQILCRMSATISRTSRSNHSNNLIPDNGQPQKQEYQGQLLHISQSHDLAHNPPEKRHDQGCNPRGQNQKL